MLSCTPDIFFIHPDKRGLDAGTILFKFVETELKRRGVKYWMVGDKNHKPAGEFFQMLGFNKIENYYAKWIGE
jgi:GNAT superfamily N-acetyltransferase